MHPGDDLHQAAVSMVQSLPIEGLHASQIGVAILRQPDALLATDETGHRHGPQPLLAQMLHRITVNVRQLRQQGIHGIRGRGDELHQALGIVGGDVGVSQRRTQHLWVVTLGQSSLRGDAQPLALDAPPNTANRTDALGRIELLEHVGQ